MKEQPPEELIKKLRERQPITTDAQFWDRLRETVNHLRKLLDDMPEQYKQPYRKTVAGILNAYREGDISFARACQLLEVKRVE